MALAIQKRDSYREQTSYTIAEALMYIFTKFGLPREILCNCGTNLNSSVMKELYWLLGITPLKMSLYHLQTDGMLERFYWTMKAICSRKPSAHLTNSGIWLFPTSCSDTEKFHLSPWGSSHLNLILGKWRAPGRVKGRVRRSAPNQSKCGIYVQKVQERLQRIRRWLGLRNGRPKNYERAVWPNDASQEYHARRPSHGAATFRVTGTAGEVAEQNLYAR